MDNREDFQPHRQGRYRKGEPMNATLVQQLNDVLNGPYPDFERVSRARSILACASESPVRSLVEEVAARNSVAPAEIMNMKCRAPKVIQARWEVWAAMRMQHYMTLPQIAVEFRTSHSTVRAGVSAHLRVRRGGAR